MATSAAHFSSADLYPQLSAAQNDAERGANLDVEHCCLFAQAGEEGQLIVLVTDRCMLWTPSTTWQAEGTMLYPRVQTCLKLSALELIGTYETLTESWEPTFTCSPSAGVLPYSKRGYLHRSRGYFYITSVKISCGAFSETSTLSTPSTPENFHFDKDFSGLNTKC